jgi:hypothetical protein
MDELCVCGAPWPTGQVTCAACGGTAKRLLARGKFEGEGNAQVKPTTVLRRFWGKNWYLVIVYVVLQLIFAAVSYWTSEFISVGWSLVGSVISTTVGFYMIVRMDVRDTK